MKHIGAHVTSEPDLTAAPLQARELGARAFALNLVDPKRWHKDALSEDEAEAFRRTCAECGYEPRFILPHASFLINLASPDRRKLNVGRQAFIDELRRCRMLGIPGLNFHPGAHLGQLADDEALRLVADSINYCLEKTEGVCAVIENTAGQGSNLGYTFEQIAEIISQVDDRSRVGVCIDTCHAFAAGYDLRTSEGYRQVWSDFESTLGFDLLRGMHLNDSMRGLGSRIDRHAPIGGGEIGTEFFAMLMRDPRFDNLPLILETPDPSAWRSEIALLYSMETSNNTLD